MEKQGVYQPRTAVDTTNPPKGSNSYDSNQLAADILQKHVFNGGLPGTREVVNKYDAIEAMHEFYNARIIKNGNVNLQQLEVPGNTPATIAWNLRERSLEELFEMFPVTVMYKGKKIGFAFTRLHVVYCCKALLLDTKGDANVYLDDARKEVLEFESPNPKTVVAMMIGWIKSEGLVEDKKRKV